MTLPTTIFLYIATAVSVAAFFIYFLDKCLAKAGAWRVPEKVLLSLSVLFGGVGGLASMLLFRHKTKHWYFKYGMPLILVVQVVLINYITN